MSLLPIRSLRAGVRSSLLLCALAAFAPVYSFAEEPAPVPLKTAVPQKQDAREGALEIREKELALEKLKESRKWDRVELEQKQEKAARKMSAAEKDLKQFQSHGRERAIAEARLKLKRSRDQYEYKKEELDQLRQMYTEDQLTDASEEIVLKRTMREVEDALFDSEGREIATKFEIEVLIPRREQELIDAVEAARIEWERAGLQLKFAEKEYALALDKAVNECDKARASHSGNSADQPKN